MKIIRRTGVQLDRRSSIIVLTLIGILFFAIGGMFLDEAMTLTKHGLVTDAEVVNVLARRENNRTNYTPEVRFTTLDGQIIHTRLDTSSHSASKYVIGSKINVVYLQDNPNEVLVNSLLGKFGFPLIFCGSGLVLMGTAFALFLKR